MTVILSDVLNRARDACAAKADPATWVTIAQDRVFLPRDWPVQEIDVPILKFQAPAENKESLGKSGIQFTTTGEFEIIGEVSRPAEDNDAAAGKVLTALMMFARQVEMAVIGDPILFGGDVPGLIQQLQTVTTQYATKADGKVHRGAFSMKFSFNWYQGTEDFQLPTTVDLDTLHLFADLINVADPSGTYTPPMNYQPTPAPRTDGPDGRVEGEIEVTIPHN